MRHAAAATVEGRFWRGVVDENGEIVVVSPIKDTPAEKAGIKSGDIISTVDGQNYDAKTMNEAVKAMRGEKGKTVVVEFSSPNIEIDKINNVIIVGHGKMGEMLSSNLDVLGEGFKIVGIFDKDKNKIGKTAANNLIVQEM